MQTNIPLAYQLAAAAAGGGSWLHQPYIQMQHQLQPVRTQSHLTAHLNINAEGRGK